MPRAGSARSRLRLGARAVKSNASPRRASAKPQANEVPPMVMIGQQMGDFLIEGELGSGAMGTVYKVKYVPKDRVMALKIISIGLSGNETAVRRFERES